MRIEDLERELRAERPEIDPEFARKLDDWAAAGFPRGGELDRRARGRAQTGFWGFLGGAGDWLRRTRERITSVPPRRILAPAGAAATLIVVGAVAISQIGDDEAAPVGDSTARATRPAQSSRSAPEADAGGEAATGAAPSRSPRGGARCRDGERPTTPPRAPPPTSTTRPPPPRRSTAKLPRHLPRHGRPAPGRDRATPPRRRRRRGPGGRERGRRGHRPPRGLRPRLAGDHRPGRRPGIVRARDPVRPARRHARRPLRARRRDLAHRDGRGHHQQARSRPRRTTPTSATRSPTSGSS